MRIYTEKNIIQNQEKNLDSNDVIYGWLKDMFPIHRSLTGNGNRRTLKYIQSLVPNLNLMEIKSGEKVYDWEIPLEWNFDHAYIDDEFGNRILDTKNNNLHVVGYSYPIDIHLNLNELQKFLNSRKDIPDAIPYITSYYKKKSGFCISHTQREELKQQKYHAVIKSEFSAGSMSMADLIIKGNDTKEILFSTYICHPQMANNELSGPVVMTALARWLEKQEKLNYTYRFVFVPETIGSIAYISNNLKDLKKSVKAGFVVSCVGDRGDPSFGASRMGNTYADNLIESILIHNTKSFKKYKFLENGGSDDRQYCSPLVDLPVVLFSRSFCDFKEYHTSLDNLDAVTPDSLGDSLSILIKLVCLIENDKKYILTTHCEPQLGKRGLYRNTQDWVRPESFVNQQKFLAYCDGKTSLLEICTKTHINPIDLIPLLDALLYHKIIKEV